MKICKWKKTQSTNKIKRFKRIVIKKNYAKLTKSVKPLHLIKTRKPIKLIGIKYVHTDLACNPVTILTFSSKIKYHIYTNFNFEDFLNYKLKFRVVKIGLMFNIDLLKVSTHTEFCVLNYYSPK